MAAKWCGGITFLPLWVSCPHTWAPLQTMFEWILFFIGHQLPSTKPQHFLESVFPSYLEPTLFSHSPSSSIFSQNILISGCCLPLSKCWWPGEAVTTVRKVTSGPGVSEEAAAWSLKFAIILWGPQVLAPWFWGLVSAAVLIPAHGTDVVIDTLDTKMSRPRMGSLQGLHWEVLLRLWGCPRLGACSCFTGWKRHLSSEHLTFLGRPSSFPRKVLLL